ncbi:MAG: histidine phosphatase family protein [Ruminococcaceae bacterium]|nr:histidine phosphatase family protein [Oscillospiraceae bacterium]
MIKLILVRHGYSTSNASGTYTGQLNAPLNEVGRAQAAQLADYLCTHERIDAVYASDLSRAAETVRPTADRLGLPLVTLPALRELDVGAWTGVSYAEVRERYAADFTAYTQNIDAPCTGGESIRTASARLLACIKEIAQKEAGKTVLLCSHALCSRLCAALAATGRVEDVTAQKAPANASFCIYEYESGRFKPLVRDFTAHLDNATSTSPKGLV